MFDDFAVVIEPKNINACPIGVPWPLLITMQDHVVAFGNHPLEVDTLARIVLGHLREGGDESLLAITHRNHKRSQQECTLNINQIGNYQQYPYK